MTVEPVLTLLYLAGYVVLEIVIGEGDAEDEWVTFDPTDSRIRSGTVTWTAQTPTTSGRRKRRRAPSGSPACSLTSTRSAEQVTCANCDRIEVHDLDGLCGPWVAG